VDLIHFAIVAIIIAIAIHESIILIGSIAKGGSDYWQKWGVWAVLETFALVPLCYFLLNF
jgi:hypothetical protein